VGDGGQPEVADLDLESVGEEEVAEFEVSVNDLLCVDMLDGLYNLAHVVLDFYFGEHLPAFEQFAEGLSDCIATLLLQSYSSMYTNSWSSKKCSNFTM
jgi:hypothetical protein